MYDCIYVHCDITSTPYSCPFLTHNYNFSEAIDTDQSVALMVAKVTTDTDRW